MAFDNQRLMDLVRFCRHKLYDENLITKEEFVELVSVGSGSARRLEDYDGALRRWSARQHQSDLNFTALEKQNTSLTERITELEAMLEDRLLRVAELEGLLDRKVGQR